MTDAKLRACRWLWIAVLLLLPFLLGFTLPGEFNRLLEAGNRLYARGKFQEALARYAAALKITPDAPQALFNRGAAQYRLKAFDNAYADFTKAATAAQGQLRQYAEYNAGNAAYRMQRFDDAIAAYKRALTLDPADMLAKHNLEMALRAKQQQQQQQNQQDQQHRDKQKQQKQQQQQQQQQEPQQQPQQPPPAPEEGKNREAEPRDVPTQPLSPEQAEQLLRSLAQEDAAIQKIIRRAPLTPERPTDKDW